MLTFVMLSRECSLSATPQSGEIVSAFQRHFILIFASRNFTQTSQNFTKLHNFTVTSCRVARLPDHQCRTTGRTPARAEAPTGLGSARLAAREVREVRVSVDRNLGYARVASVSAVLARVPRVLIAVATLVPHPPEVCAYLVCVLLRAWTHLWAVRA